MSESRLRPRSVSELVDTLFALLRQHYVGLLTMAATGFVPVAALAALAAMVGGASIVSDSPEVAAILLWGVVLLAAIVAFPVTFAAMTIAASDAYLYDSIDPADAFRRGAARFWATIGAYLVIGFATLLGLLCLIVGAFYVTAALFATLPIMLIEGLGPMGAATRSSHLSKGRKLPILGAIFLVGIITTMLSSAVQTGAQLTLGESGATVAKVVMMFLLFPVNTVMPVLLYYDARVRKEGFDLEFDAAAFTTGVAPAQT